MPTCSACEAEVVFVPSARTGKPMILDAEPEKRIVLLDGGTEPVYGIDHVRAVLRSGTGRAKVASVFIDHHATCPEAERFRR
jgi:hypothetical protein